MYRQVLQEYGGHPAIYLPSTEYLMYLPYGVYSVRSIMTPHIDVLYVHQRG